MITPNPDPFYETIVYRDLEVQSASGLTSMLLEPADRIDWDVNDSPFLEFASAFTVTIMATGQRKTFYKQGREWMSLAERTHRRRIDPKKGLEGLRAK